MDGDGSNQRRVTADPAADFPSAWSPDGKKIALVSNRTDRNNRIKQIWVIDADGKNPIRLTEGLGDSNPDWSPDGKKIVYDAHLDPEEHDLAHDGITVMDADGKDKRLLTPEGAHPSWSPDGKRIAYAHGQIYVMDADGRNQIQLTHDFVNKRFPSWSLDEKRIACVGNHRIWVMDSDGENQRQLTKINGDNHPTWSPDSESIAFHSFEKDRGISAISRRILRFAGGQPYHGLGQAEEHRVQPPVRCVLGGRQGRISVIRLLPGLPCITYSSNQSFAKEHIRKTSVLAMRKLTVGGLSHSLFSRLIATISSKFINDSHF